VEAIGYGWGGISLVSQATKISRITIKKGIKEVEAESENGPRIRKKGGGRKKISDQTNGVMLQEIEKLIDPETKGNPESSLRWTSKSVTKLADELNKKGFEISYRTVARLLKEMGYTLQANRKKYEGKKPSYTREDRNTQFEYINQKIASFTKRECPTISVDTKKKELIGNFKNNGKEWKENGKPTNVQTYDFSSLSKGKVAPYGIYDIGKNIGWVSVGISSDTAAFSVNSIRTWWYQKGCRIYSHAPEILITADSGGSNSSRGRLWKLELQKLANEINKTIHVSHFPPGTSKWNKIEHRLFSYISKNWRGRPLINIETIINLISNTTTKTGLEVIAVLDKNIYNKGIKVKDKTMKLISLSKDSTLPFWNYSISPNNHVFV
jgi:transposase